MTIDRWEVVNTIASSISAIASLVAIPFVIMQLRSNNQIAKAQLINELERDISIHLTTITRLGIGGNYNLSRDASDLTEEERIGILTYISFFERVHVIINTGVLDLQTIDYIFGGRFFYLFNNPIVKDLIKSSEFEPYMISIRELYAKWYTYRKSKNLPIPLE
jgi:hypothetical protein